MDRHQNYYEVRWKNFKGFKDSKWIKIKPLTILLGSNNTGKTSFLAPFLLMNQTLASRDSNSALITKGGVYDGGNIQELVNDYNLGKNISFGFKYHIHETDEKIEKVGNYPPGGIEVTLGVYGKKEDGEIRVKKESIYDTYFQEFFSFTLKEKKKYEFSGPLASSKMNAEEIDAIANCSPLNFVFSPDSILSNFFRKKSKETPDETPVKRKKRFTVEFEEVIDALSYNYSRVMRYIGELSYIGPVREHPHRIYEISNESLNTVGPKGENMANLMKRYFGNKGRHPKVDEWIKRFEFGDWLELKHLYGNTYSIRFRNDGSDIYTSIANAGFGASQLLPLIIQALVSPKGSLTIAEQPEIHLNPRLQCELADLFAFMVNQKQRAIIETHSEYLLLRLRKLIAQKVISNNDVALYFVEKKNGQSAIKEIPIESDGHIDFKDWPSDFFEDTLRESISLANQQAKLKN
ncbi:DUF3696 domain-containing protein [Ferruginibacter sp. HRS2-29]|uniref:AAA family ATPase n=1 Tax=Ferruginibacter sp. HRS2-29 TaxID=2487334 RepID=UPI0020CBC949|nr:DUF3696 domain-containing protein [Ferruginibacter sp. HRS2-29]MCP9752365.1 DUF3696 domain-containing protein [Ferruginibacter sp. HRS2-29]